MKQEEQYLFDGQRDKEEVLFVWRRNMWTNAKTAFIVVFLTLALLFLLIQFGASQISSVAIGIWLITVPYIIGRTWFLWWNDIYILTNQRVIDIDQKSFFHRLVAEVPLENVQDATFEIKGLIPTTLNYGIVQVQTFSGRTTISIEGVTDPMAIQQAILRTAAQSKES